MATYKEKRGTNVVPIVSGKPDTGVNGEIVYITGEGLASYNGGTWSKLTATVPPQVFNGTHTRFLANPENENSGFGKNTSLSDAYILVGAWNKTIGSVSDAGAAYLFDYSGTLVRTFNPPSPAAYTASSGQVQFGKNTTQTPDGAYSYISYAYYWNGTAHQGTVSQYNNSTGALVRNIHGPVTDSVGNFSKYFAHNGLEASANYVVIGCTLYGTVSGQTYSGRVYCYDHNGNLQWTKDNPNATGTTHYDHFGDSLSISPDENYVAVSAHYEDNPGGDETGVVYLLNMSDGSVAQTFRNPDANTNFAYTQFYGGRNAVGCSNTHTVVGSQGWNGGVNYTGRAWVFNNSDGSTTRTHAAPSGNTTDYQWGDVVAACNDFYAISEEGKPASGAYSKGAVYVYKMSDGTLLYTIRNTDSNTSNSDDKFGNASSGGRMSLRANGSAVTLAVSISGQDISGNDGAGGQVTIWN